MSRTSGLLHALIADQLPRSGKELSARLGRRGISDRSGR
jgi:hypothetical protein